MIVLVPMIVLLRELIVSTIFCMVHPYIAIHSVEWFLHLFHTFLLLRVENAVTRMRTLPVRRFGTEAEKGHPILPFCELPFCNASILSSFHTFFTTVRPCVDER